VRRDFSSSVLATGAVKPQVGAQVRVGARVSGKVEKLRANIGDSVKAGQTIAELEKADLQATVGQRQAELNLAEAKLAAIESLLPQQIQKAESDCARAYQSGQGFNGSFSTDFANAPTQGHSDTFNTPEPSVAVMLGSLCVAGIGAAVRRRFKKAFHRG